MRQPSIMVLKTLKKGSICIILVYLRGYIFIVSFDTAKIMVSIPELSYFLFAITLMFLISAITYMLTTPEFQLIPFTGALASIFPTVFYIFLFVPVTVTLYPTCPKWN